MVKCLAGVVCQPGGALGPGSRRIGAAAGTRTRARGPVANTLAERWIGIFRRPCGSAGRLRRAVSGIAMRWGMPGALGASGPAALPDMAALAPRRWLPF